MGTWYCMDNVMSETLVKCSKCIFTGILFLSLSYITLICHSPWSRRSHSDVRYMLKCVSDDGSVYPA